MKNSGVFKKIFLSHKSDNRLVAKIHEELLELNKNKTAPLRDGNRTGIDVSSRKTNGE
jgi:hypothetical protein